MVVEKRSINGHTVLGIEGVVKLGESARFFAETLQRVFEQETGDVIVNLSAINYIDSTGIGELVGYLAKLQERRRRLVLVSPSDRIKKLLEVAQLAPLFPTFDSVEAALASSPEP